MQHAQAAAAGPPLSVHDLPLADQAASDLFGRGRSKRQIRAKRFDHPIAIGADMPRVISVDPNGVCESDQIKPERRHALGVTVR